LLCPEGKKVDFVPPLNIKKGSSSHSANDLHNPNAPKIGRQTLAVLVDNESDVLAPVIGIT
jgi:acetolactate synthase-1/3 small subunit